MYQNVISVGICVLPFEAQVHFWMLRCANAFLTGVFFHVAFCFPYFAFSLYWLEKLAAEGVALHK
jgi:hypothetical protein